MDNNQTQPAQTETKPTVVIAGKELTKRLDLPTENAYVVLLTNPKASVLTQMGEDGVDATNKNMIPYLVREWNFADEQGNILPINTENADKALSLQDTAAIFSFLGLDKLMSGSKKNS